MVTPILDTALVLDSTVADFTVVAGVFGKEKRPAGADPCPGRHVAGNPACDPPSTLYRVIGPRMGSENRIFSSQLVQFFGRRSGIDCFFSKFHAAA